jgi:hypothetical protein
LRIETVNPGRFVDLRQGLSILSIEAITHCKYFVAQIFVKRLVVFIMEFDISLSANLFGLRDVFFNECISLRKIYIVHKHVLRITNFSVIQLIFIGSVEAL